MSASEDKSKMWGMSGPDSQDGKKVRWCNNAFSLIKMGS